MPPTALGALATEARASSRYVVAAARAQQWRGWVERAGAAAPKAPMWTSRDGWLTAVHSWAHAPGFAACCQAAGVSLSSATVLAVARVMAAHADHATGRHCAVTRATIAEHVGCDPQTVTRVWRLLRTARWVVEASRGHGSPGTPAAGRRPSVYHLVPRRDPTPVGGNVYLPPSGGVSTSPPVGNHSPRARKRAENINPPRKRRTRCRAAPPPRPLPVQRLAAELVRDCHGLDHGHIGAICDALTASGVDPGVWTARTICAALDADMRARGGTWPDHIQQPGAFLASRLRRIDWPPPGPPHGGGCAATGPEEKTGVQDTPVTLTDDQRARIAARRAEITAILTARKTARHQREHACIVTGRR